MFHLANACIWTGVRRRPRATSITIEGGRVAALDTAAPRAALVWDARGRTVIPGLIDAHIHLLLGGLSLERLDLSGVRSRAQFERTIAERSASLPAGQWLLAHGWSSENLADSEPPDRSWLAAAGDRPVVCHRMDLHAALVNDAVLALVGAVADPPGGTIERRRDGSPTGLLLEAAAWHLVDPLVPRPDVAQRRRAVLRAQQLCHRLGLTAVGSMEYAADVREVFVPLRDQLTLRCRITLLDRDWPLDTRFGRTFASDAAGPLAVIGYKAFIDGTLGSSTARMLEPYADDASSRGMLVELAADGHVREWAAAVAAAGLSPSMHAIGDEAARLALDVVESIGPASGPRIEHAQQIDLSDIPRFRGVIASMQPLHKADDGRYAPRRLGPARLAGTFAFRRILDAGGLLAFGSDWPVVSCDPLAGIRAAVTGLTTDGERFLPDQNLTVEEALAAYTSGAARALQLVEAGALEPGRLADLVVLDRDPFRADWAGAPPRVVCTMAGGRLVYDEPGWTIAS